MDAVQFGSWLGQRRRKYGFRSQRALVEHIRGNAMLRELGISEDFLARLESGQLVHPFRGNVRQRVLGLAWLLCKTARDVKNYLHAAELTQLTTEETAHLQLLYAHLTPRAAAPIMSLPRRPQRLIGRVSLVQELLEAIRTIEAGCCAITGMPGVGKSVLVSEVVHELVANEHERQQLFPDGIATFTCSGWHGSGGLLALLNEIALTFHAVPPSSSHRTQVEVAPSSIKIQSMEEGKREIELAYAIERTRLALADKRVLLVLDDLEADFPLRRALDALLGQGPSGTTHTHAANYANLHPRRVVLTTGRYVPTPALVHHHLHIGPLAAAAAHELLILLTGCADLYVEDVDAIEQICAAVGYLPLAIELAATAITVEGIPLSLLAAHLVEQPLDNLLDSEHELRSKLAQAVAALEPEMQRHFVLLSTLGVPSFGLESATALHPAPDSIVSAEPHATVSTIPTLTVHQSVQLQPLAHITPILPGNTAHSTSAQLPLQQLAHTAAELGQLVRHSLIELDAATTISLRSGAEQRVVRDSQVRYRFHPLLRAHAVNALPQLEPEVVDEARRNVQHFALSFLELHKEDVDILERECDFLLASLEQAIRLEQYADVIRFVNGLVPITCRLYSPVQGEKLVRWGIEASQHLHDRHAQAWHLVQLGDLFCMRGELRRARQAFEESLALGMACGNSPTLALPLGGLAHVAHIQGDYATAFHLTEQYLHHCEEAGKPFWVASALHLHAFYARLLGKLDEAHTDVQSALNLFALHRPTFVPSHAQRVELQLKAEFARIQGDFAQSQQYVEEVAALIEKKCDRYLLADLLFDQACYAHQQGKHAELRILAARVMQISAQIGSTHFHSRSLRLLQQLPERMSMQPGRPVYKLG